MKKMLIRAAVGLSAVILCGAVIADATGYQIAAPAGFVPTEAIGFAGSDGKYVQDSAATPHPVTGDLYANCLVVSGDQAYTLATYQRCTMTASGRVKVGLSSAAAEGGTIAGYSDLAGALGTDGLQHALRLDGSYNLKVAGTFWQATQPVSGSVAITNGSPTYANGATYDAASGSYSSYPMGCAAVSAAPSRSAGNVYGCVMGPGGGIITANSIASALNITAATLVKASSGRLVRVNVIAAGSTAGGCYDVAATASVATANQVTVIPATTAAGTSYALDMPMAAGIVCTPGTGGVLAVSYN